jgi:hypothetical protein
MSTPACGIRLVAPIALLLLNVWLSQTAAAEDPPSIQVTLKDHRFSPSEIHVPTGKPVLLKLRNEDPTAEEFDSSALKVEKIVAGGASVIVRLRPLGPGRFPFMGEFHPDTAQGFVISE